MGWRMKRKNAGGDQVPGSFKSEQGFVLPELAGSSPPPSIARTPRNGDHRRSEQQSPRSHLPDRKHVVVPDRRIPDEQTQNRLPGKEPREPMSCPGAQRLSRQVDQNARHSTTNAQSEEGANSSCCRKPSDNPLPLAPGNGPQINPAQQQPAQRPLSQFSPPVAELRLPRASAPSSAPHSLHGDKRSVTSPLQMLTQRRQHLAGLALQKIERHGQQPVLTGGRPPRPMPRLARVHWSLAQQREETRRSMPFESRHWRAPNSASSAQRPMRRGRFPSRATRLIPPVCRQRNVAGFVAGADHAERWAVMADAASESTRCAHHQTPGPPAARFEPRGVHGRFEDTTTPSRSGSRA